MLKSATPFPKRLRYTHISVVFYSMKMTTEIIKTNDFYQTPDLAIATTISLFYPLEGIDRQTYKALFIFRRDKQLDTLIEGYWRGELKVEPQAYFNAMRAIKTRLYNQK